MYSVICCLFLHQVCSLQWEQRTWIQTSLVSLEVKTLCPTARELRGCSLIQEWDPHAAKCGLPTPKKSTLRKDTWSPYHWGSSLMGDGPWSSQCQPYMCPWNWELQRKLIEFQRLWTVFSEAEYSQTCCMSRGLAHGWEQSLSSGNSAYAQAPGVCWRGAMCRLLGRAVGRSLGQEGAGQS